MCQEYSNYNKCLLWVLVLERCQFVLNILVFWCLKIKNLRDLNQENEEANLSDHQVVYIWGKTAYNEHALDAELSRRIKLVCMWFEKLRNDVFNTKYPWYLKTSVFNQCVPPIFAYATETWLLKESTMEKMKRTQVDLERLMVGVEKTWMTEKRGVVRRMSKNGPLSAYHDLVDWNSRNCPQSF